MKTDLIVHKEKLNDMAELGWQEKRTTDYLKRAIPLTPLKTGFGEAKTGLLYQIGKGDRAILLRADIDALKTKNGPKHICGHSSHTAGLLQSLLDTMSDKTNLARSDMSIYFLFQPAEETYPSGAKAFMEECPDIIGKIRYAFASHVRPLMKNGEVGLQAGPVMARGDYFEMDIIGRMSHVKNPLKGIDAIEAGSLFVTAIKSYQKKNYRHLRINVGTIQGGLQPNTVADFCQLRGDIRLDDDGLQKNVKKYLLETIRSVERKTGASVKLRYYDGYPVLSNDERLIKTVGQFMAEDGNKIVQENLFSYGCEDFSFISHRIPSVFAFIGTGNKFDIHDENCSISNTGTESVYRYFRAIIRWWQAT